MRQVVEFSDEAEERRRGAGLKTGFGPKKKTKYRARQIYYGEVKPQVWRVMIAAGVGRFEVRQTSDGSQIAG
jgi:hypothetical protein